MSVCCVRVTVVTKGGKVEFPALFRDLGVSVGVPERPCGGCLGEFIGDARTARDGDEISHGRLGGALTKIQRFVSQDTDTQTHSYR